MRVLVTGGAGFIGSHVADAFLARGDDVAVIDDFSRGQAGRLDSRVTAHKLSITDAKSLGGVVQAVRPDLICHLAAQIDVRASVADPAADAEVNVAGTVNVLEAARAAGARVVFTSSGGALYGRDAAIPSPEDAPTLPESPYGVAKLCGEHYVGLYNRLHGTGHSVLRLANVYGPRQDPAGEAGVIAVFCSRVLGGQAPLVFGDGTQTRDYVYVGDVVRAFVAAADGGQAGTWNIGTGTETTVLDLIALIGQTAGREVTPEFAAARAGELLRSSVAPGRAADELGWRPQTALADGIRNVYRWIAEGSPVRAAC
ncbi:MAG TPA: NAD-dependent epimerase/dehydratase family protein [Streptosporangiaceae bacterium]|jgi:UDP-glucose 4-epimerase